MQEILRFLPAAPKGWRYELVYKPIRHIYFRIYPDKRIVRISAPSRISSGALKHAVQAKSAWLTEKMAAAGNGLQPLTPFPAAGGRCACMVWGRQLPVVRQVCNSRPGIYLRFESEIVVRVPSGFDPKKEKNLWDRWQRTLLNQRIQSLLEKWQPVMGAAPAEFRLKKMKTRWGSCNTVAKRIWINTALVHLDPCLLEYVLVHELVHLLEPGHTPRFYRVLGTYLPDWKARDACLNKTTPGE